MISTRTFSLYRTINFCATRTKNVPRHILAPAAVACDAYIIKKGMEVEVTVEGENEEAAAAKMEEFFKANL